MRRTLVLGVLLAAACSRPRAAAPEAAVATVAADPDPCATLRARAQALLAAGGACRSEADCACYGGRAAGDCGGVTDGTTAPALFGLNAQYAAQGCRVTRSCGPRLCHPRCVDGRCR